VNSGQFEPFGKVELAQGNVRGAVLQRARADGVLLRLVETASGRRSGAGFLWMERSVRRQEHAASVLELMLPTGGRLRIAPMI
jgi:hypothetical protein